MAGGVITAAWVQAAPIWATAIVAGLGLNTWRQQLRGERQLKHAEKALAAGQEVFVLMRAIRGHFSKYDPEDMTDESKKEAAYKKMISERFERAWTAWRKFADHYFLVRLFGTPNSARADIAKELESCLSDLMYNAEMMFDYS